jgi:branched-chain amino acid transport system permease protein
MDFVIQSIINGLAMGLGYALLGSGISVVFGVLDIVNFAHGGLYALGAYLAYMALHYLGVPYFASIPISMAGLALFGFLFSRVALVPTIGKHYSVNMLVTFGLAFILTDGLTVIFGSRPLPLDSPLTAITYRVGGLVLNMQRMLIISASLLLMVLLHNVLKRTSLGKQMRAVAQELEGACLVGIDPKRIYNWTYAIGGTLAAAAGILMGAFTTVFPTMGDLGLFKGFIVVILGGMGSIPGAVLGGILIGLTESFGGGYISAGYKHAFGYGILMVMLLLRPEGLMGKKPQR